MFLTNKYFHRTERKNNKQLKRKMGKMYKSDI